MAVYNIRAMDAPWLHRSRHLLGQQTEHSIAAATSATEIPNDVYASAAELSTAASYAAVFSDAALQMQQVSEPLFLLVQQCTPSSPLQFSRALKYCRCECS
jgi:hypothetical protein